MERVRWPPQSWKRFGRRIDGEESPDVKQRMIWDAFHYMRESSNTRQLGAGAEGEVYELCSPRNPSRCVAVKPSCPDRDVCREENRWEFLISSGEALVGLRLSQTVPSPNIIHTKMVHVSNPSQDPAITENLLDSSNVVMESLKPYRDGSSTVGDFFSKRSNLQYVPDVLIQVTDALLRIRRRYPTFRHNDLHSENVMVTEWRQTPPTYVFGGRRLKLAEGAPRAVIIDFGYATEETGDGELQTKYTILNAMETNPDYNIRPDPSEWYDMMVFLLSTNRAIREVRNVRKEIGIESIRVRKGIRPTASWCMRVERMVKNGDVKTVEQWAATTELFDGRVYARRRRRGVRGGDGSPFKALLSPIPVREDRGEAASWPPRQEGSGPNVSSVNLASPSNLNLPRPPARRVFRVRPPVVKTVDDTPTAIMSGSTTAIMSGSTNDETTRRSRKRTLDRAGGSPSAKQRSN